MRRKATSLKFDYWRFLLEVLAFVSVLTRIDVNGSLWQQTICELLISLRT